MQVLSKFQLQATVDVCFRINGLRNLTNFCLRPLFFQLSVNAGQLQASPYQIISNNKNNSSITLLDYISPTCSMGPMGKVEISEVVVFRLNVPQEQITTNPLSYKFVLFEVPSQQRQKMLNQIVIEHASLLWINSYSPVFFSNNGCAVDVSVQTQLLKYRIKDVSLAPDEYLICAIEQLLVSYNKLSIKTDNQPIFAVRTLGQSFLTYLETAKTLWLVKAQIESRDTMREFVHKYIHEVGNTVQQAWSAYLKEMKNCFIEEDWQGYLNSLSLFVKENISHQSNPQERSPKRSKLLLQTIKMKPLLLSISQISKQQALVKANPSNNHFVFLVHGYGATSLVTLQIELTLRFFFPHLIVINNKANEDKTEDDIINMGQRLAEDVEKIINFQNCGKDYTISFIAHSLGGLIVRSALTVMQQHWDHMKSFICLATPHLGHLYHNSSINKLGMWAFSKLGQSKVMSALLLESEDGDYRKSYLYQLSSSPGLDWFENVAFYGCEGDKFVSPESALFLESDEISIQQREGNQKAQIWEQMRQNMTHLLKNVGVTKYEVDFSKQNEAKQTNFTDDWLGRRDHMNLCTSQQFVQCLLIANKHLFL